ncbi:MAG: phage tail tape measure protein, partial [Kofleriaceae bacterium]
GELSPQAAAGLASQAMKAFGLSTEEAAISVDRMLQAVNVFALNANELPLALGTVSRGSQALNQSLSETLIALGLVKNVIPGVERASTAAAVAMEQLADPKVQQRLRSIGVAVVDSNGRFRAFLDVLGEMAPAMDRMTEAQRSSFLLKAFGREALGGVNAILTQLTAGMRTNTGETVRGAAAIAYLRQQFEEAGGTARVFANKMLDTYAGQKQLLGGLVQTLAIVIGEPFAKVLKPVLAVVVSGLNQLVKFLRAIPEPVKTAFAAFFVAAGAVVALIGAVVTAKAAVALFAMGMKALGISVASVALSMLPAILTVGKLSALVAGFVIAYRKNLGGIGDAARRTAELVVLAFNAIKQLFAQRGFSGAVRDELNRAENLGLKQFVIRLYQIVYRLQRIWEGFKDGFARTIEEARPIFEDLSEAFSELWTELSALFTGAADGAASLPSEAFRSFGDVVGSVVAGIATWLTQLIAIFSRITSGLISGFRSMMEYIGPAFDTIGTALSGLKDAWDSLTGATSEAEDTVSASTSGWRRFGEVLGKIVGGAVTVLALALAGLIKTITAVLWVVGVMKDAFVAFGTAVAEVALGIWTWFTETLPNAFSSALQTVVSFFTGIGEYFVGIGRWFAELFGAIGDAIKSFLQPVIDFFVGVGRAIKKVFDFIADLAIRILRKIPDILLPASLEKVKRMPLSSEVKQQDEFAAISNTQATASSAAAASSPAPAAADAQARMGAMTQLEANLMAYANEQAKLRGQAPPFQINVQVDGETIARAVHNTQQANATRSFSPVPSY